MSLSEQLALLASAAPTGLFLSLACLLLFFLNFPFGSLEFDPEDTEEALVDEYDEHIQTEYFSFLCFAFLSLQLGCCDLSHER